MSKSVREILRETPEGKERLSALERTKIIISPKVAYTHQWDWLTCRCIDCEISCLEFMEEPQGCSKKSPYAADDFSSIRQRLHEII